MNSLRPRIGATVAGLLAACLVAGQAAAEPYRAGISAVWQSVEARSGERVERTLRLENTGTETWSSDTSPPSPAVGRAVQEVQIGGEPAHFERAVWPGGSGVVLEDPPPGKTIVVRSD